MADDITLTQPDLINRLLSNLPTGYTKKLVNTPNSGFTTPANGKYLRATVLPGVTQSDAATGKCKTTFGFFVVDSFYSLGGFDQAQLLDCKAIKLLFENETFGNTQCQEASIQTIGEDSAWYHMQITINWYMVGFTN